MHALKIPFTGFFVGGFAVITIGLIASLNKNNTRQILHATALVLLVKATASPHSPFPAYIAVAFQGICGAFIYLIIPHFLTASLVFGLLAMLESALQKLIITTLIFGKSIWIAIDSFFKSILKDFSFPENTSFSLWIIIAYSALYAVWGLFLGYWTAKMPAVIEKRSPGVHEALQNKITDEGILFPVRKRQGAWKFINLILVLLFIVLVFVFSPSGKGMALYAFLRATAAVILLFFLINPLVLFLIRRISGKKRKENQLLFKELLEELSRMKKLSSLAYHVSGTKYKGIRRIREFVIILLVCALNPLQLEE